MKASHFIYSKTQKNNILDFDPKKEFHQVFINGKWVTYTEINSTGNSNFEDAQHLGIHPRWWVKCNGVIQDNDLAFFIDQGDSKQ
tara:strand:+ start:350 stop:604 length:255 start_codon:yes stop_codon:yes gene_type:complete